MGSKYIIGKEGNAGAWTYFLLELDEDEFEYKVIARCPNRYEADKLVTALNSEAEPRLSYNDLR